MALPKNIDSDAQYAVKLAKAVTVGKRNLVPRLEHTVKGSVLLKIKDDVTDAKRL